MELRGDARRAPRIVLGRVRNRVRGRPLDVRLVVVCEGVREGQRQPWCGELMAVVGTGQEAFTIRQPGALVGVIHGTDLRRRPTCGKTCRKRRGGSTCVEHVSGARLSKRPSAPQNVRGLHPVAPKRHCDCWLNLGGPVPARSNGPELERTLKSLEPFSSPTTIFPRGAPRSGPAPRPAAPPARGARRAIAPARRVPPSAPRASVAPRRAHRPPAPEAAPPRLARDPRALATTSFGPHPPRPLRPPQFQQTLSSWLFLRARWFTSRPASAATRWAPR